MRSKNKPAMTAAERRHVDRVAQLPCVIDNVEGVEVHEFGLSGITCGRVHCDIS